MELHLDEIKTVILAGGKGTRLYPLSVTIPKPMILLQNKPLLYHILRQAQKYGFSKYLFKTGYLSEKIEEYFGDGSKFWCQINYFIEQEPLGTAGGLKFLEKEKNPIIVLYGDVLLNFNLRKLYEFHLKNNCQATLVVHKSDHPEDSDVVVMDGNNKIKKVVHKPKNHEFGNITNAALYILNPECFSLIPDKGAFDFGKELIPKLVDNKFNIYGYYSNEYIKDVGTIRRYEEVNHYLNNKVIKKYNLSVIIPTYKEENRIERCIRESLFFLKNNDRINQFELIFVADNAGDRTIEIIKSFAEKNPEIRFIVNPKREQKGGSIKVGMLKAQYELMLFYDVDLSTPLYEVDNFLNEIENYDILIGSRGMEQSKIEKKWFKVMLSRGFSTLKHLSLGINLKDTQCGFKMFKNKCRMLFEKQTINSSAFDVELLFIARKMGLKIKEVPITWIDSDMSNFNTTQVILRFLRDVFKIRINEWKGRYK